MRFLGLLLIPLLLCSHVSYAAEDHVDKMNTICERADRMEVKHISRIDSGANKGMYLVGARMMHPVKRPSPEGVMDGHLTLTKYQIKEFNLNVGDQSFCYMTMFQDDLKNNYN